MSLLLNQKLKFCHIFINGALDVVTIARPKRILKIPDPFKKVARGEKVEYESLY